MIQIRPGTDADRPQILSRIEEVLGDEPARRAERLWDWQWHQDPRLPTPGFRGIVADWEGKIIGNHSTIPAGLQIAGAPVEAWWCVDVLVHFGLARKALRAHLASRKKGNPPDPGSDLSRGVAAALLDHPAAGPIQLAKHISDPMTTIALRIGFVANPDSGSMHRRVSIRHPLRRAIGAPLGNLAGSIADLALPRIPAPRLPVRPLDGAFGPGFDDLWEKARRAYPSICQRDSALLQWRYNLHPDADYRALVLESDDGLRGYVVVKVFERERRRRAKLVDLLALPGDTPAVEALLAGALQTLRRERVERVEAFVCGEDMRRAMLGIGFTHRLTKRQRPRPMITRRFPGPADGLYVTQGDGDGG